MIVVFKRKIKSKIFYSIVSFLLLIIVYVYYQNYKQQNIAIQQLKFQESQINQLNAINITLLKAVREARGFRIYQEKDLKTNYIKYRNRTFVLIELYQNQKGKLNYQELLYFNHLKRCILRRFENLDYVLTQPATTYDENSGQVLSAQLDSSTKLIIADVDASFDSIHKYWLNKSKKSFALYQHEKSFNDIVFVISVVLLIILILIWLDSSNKFIKRLYNLNKSLNEKNKQIERSKKELESFAYIASHDLKTPLRSIKGLLGIIKKKGDTMNDAKKQEYFDVVVEAAENMNKLIDNLLEYSRTGEIMEELQEHTVEAIFQTQLNYFELELAKYNGQISTVSDVKTISVYPVLFQRLLMNLISNAIKYRSENPPQIQIQCSDNKDTVLFTVKDNGVGIPEQHFQSIFQLFKSIKPNKDSNGIGLAVCKKIVELHNGKIWLESKVGEGSTFYFTIPKK